MNIEELMLGSSKALKKAALNEAAKSYILENKALFQLLKKAANRYVAGEHLEDINVKVKSINSRNVPCTVDFMGESTRTEKEANAVTKEFLRLARLIKKAKLDSTISLDLSHIGLAVDKQLGLENLLKICKEDIEVIISAEGTDRTDRVLETYLEASKYYNNVGITLQAYLHRSENDLQELVKCEGKIRIVKGAFDTPHGTSLARGEKLDNRYLNFVRMLLEARHKCSVATHDPKIQNGVIRLLEDIETPSNYEFESLLGIENERIYDLNRHHPTKIYVVYGVEWYLYLCNRIAEYPPGIFQSIIDVMNDT